MNNFFWGILPVADIRNEKKKILDSAPVFEHEHNGFCGILESYSSFCTREITIIKF